LTDRVINQMEGVQNLRKAVYEWVCSVSVNTSVDVSVNDRTRRDEETRDDETARCLADGVMESESRGVLVDVFETPCSLD
jgi:hypothetical protein